jgi:hypothetical protein
MLSRPLFDCVEDLEHAAQVGLASSFHQAVQIALSRPAVIEQRRLMRRQESEAIGVLQRAFVLTEYAVDGRYENPYDAALLTYLGLLAETNHLLAVMLAVRLQEVSNLWWSAKLGHAILTESRTRNDAGSVGDGTQENQAAAFTTYCLLDSSMQHIMAARTEGSAGHLAGTESARAGYFEASPFLNISSHVTGQMEVAA